MEYRRHHFPHWLDINGNGMDARREAIHNSILTGRNQILCPYTGRLFFIFSNLDADHVVSLKWAWEHGADKWKEKRRSQFANDQKNLIMTANFTNRSKGSRGPFEWLPPNANYIPKYVFKYATICKIYELKGFTFKDADIIVSASEKFSKGIKIGLIRRWYFKWFGGKI